MIKKLKNISLLVLALLLLGSMLLIGIPLNVEAETPGADFTGVWAADGSDTPGHANYDHKTAAELAAEVKAETGKTVTFTAITDYAGWCAMTNGTADALHYYYLDLSGVANETLVLNGSSNHEERQMSYIYVDGNGYTIDVSGYNNAAFGRLDNATIKNLKLTGDLEYVSAYSSTTAQRKTNLGKSPLTSGTEGNIEGQPGQTVTANQNNGVVYLDNIFSDVEFAISQRHGSGKPAAGIIHHVRQGSQLNRCVFEGTITTKDRRADWDSLPPQPGYVGGIVGDSWGGTYTNCISRGTITIEEGARFGGANDEAQLGGLLGHAQGDTLVENCLNETDITINAHAWKSDVDSTMVRGYIGGIAGIIASESTVSNYVNCTNRGVINITTGEFSAGGIGGAIYKGGNVKNCVNEGAIKATNAGGIIGEFGATDVANSKVQIGTEEMPNVNKGSITATAYAGGIVGIACQDATLSYATNNGNVTTSYTETLAIDITDDNAENDGPTTVLGGAGGIFGTVVDSKTLTISNCTNTGAVSSTVVGNGAVTSGDTAITVKVISGAGGIIGVMNDSTTISNCTSSNPEKDITAQTTNNPSRSGSNITRTSIPAAGGIAGYSTGAATISSSTGNMNVYSRYAGGVLGYAEGVVKLNGCTSGASNDNVTVESKLLGTNGEIQGAIGGVLGQGATTTYIANCKNYARIVNPTSNSQGKTAKYVGGIAGKIVGNAYIGYDVSNGTTTGNAYACYNYGTVQVNSYINDDHTQYTGGIIGHIVGNSNIAHCENQGNINVGARPSYVLGGVGGIVGVPFDGENKTANIVNCTNRGNITSTSGHDRIYISDTEYILSTDAVGGIAGRVFNKSGSTLNITGSYNYGNLKASLIAGGMVGITEGSAVVLNTCTNDADITAHYAGGMLSLAARQTSSMDTGRTDAAGNPIKKVLWYPKGDWGQRAQVKMTNCTNGSGKDSCTITTVGANFQGAIGGMVGSSNAPLHLAGCKNNAKILNEAGKNGNAKYIGGLVGYTNTYCYIGFDVNNTSTSNDSTKCSNYGTVENLQYFNSDHIQAVAGIVGYPVKGGSFKNCYNYGAINVTVDANKKAWGAIGGIIALPNDTDGVTTTVESCTNGGTITLTGYVPGYGKNLYDYALGGIVGIIRMNSDCTVTSCTNTGTLTGTTVGGIAGAVLSNKQPQILSCVNEGNIFGGHAGGILGTNEWNTVIKDSTNRGTIKINAASFEKPNIGGLVGRAHHTLMMDNCQNDGAVIADVNNTAETAETGIGGLIGFGTTASNCELNFCRNNGPVSTLAPVYHVGGIAGLVSGHTELTYCQNTEKGIITTSDGQGIMTAVGGIIGYAKGSSESYAQIYYCENRGRIQLAHNCTGDSLYVGGILGRSASNYCDVNINNCRNGGVIDVYNGGSSNAGGIMGTIQTWNAPSDFTCDITNSVNDARIRAKVAAGIFCLPYAHGDTDAKMNLTVNIIDCINNGEIDAVDRGAGIVANRNGGVPTLILTRCINFGTVKGTYRGGILSFSVATVTFDTCISMGAIANGDNAYPLAPKVGSGGTFTGNTTCPISKDIAATAGTSGTRKEAATIRSEYLTNVKNYNKQSIIALYTHACRVVDTSIYGANKTAFENARNALKPYAAMYRTGSGSATNNLTYFTVGDATAQAAYNTLNNIMYSFTDATTFTVFIPESVTLTGGGQITGTLKNFNALSKLDVKVSGDFVLTRQGSTEDTIEYRMLMLNDEGNEVEVHSGDTILTLDSDSNSAVYDFKTEITKDCNIPGLYTGKLTFTIKLGQYGK